MIVDCISRAQAQTEIEMNASRYTIAKERGGMGQVEWSDQLIKVSDAVDIIRHLPPVTPQEPRWIPMIRREPTDEEKAEYLIQNGEELCYMLENEMPLNGQEVLVSIGEFVSEDVFDEDFYNFENNDIENVDAWMPKPKPYKESEE